MERCPVCKNRGGLEYGCIGDMCDVALWETCDLDGCHHCVDCDTVALSDDDISTNEISDLSDAYDVEGYVWNDNFDWVKQE